ncbi:putative DNA-directed RNA polymerase III subunit RPC10 [Sesbania bispinosa]|nr:putative DNA-directed RNA polymerase III subunit RPC10 [Sesbania bispinosa]
MHVNGGREGGRPEKWERKGGGRVFVRVILYLAAAMAIAPFKKNNVVTAKPLLAVTNVHEI